MRSARFPAWWWLALLPGTARVGADLWQGHPHPLAWAAVLAPGFVVLAVAAWTHASSWPLAVQLKKELRTFGAVAMGAVAPGLALVILPRNTVAVVVGLAVAGTGAFLAAMRAFQTEVEHDRLNPWLLVPMRRRALVTRKLSMVWLVFGAFAATLALAGAADDLTVVTLVFLGLAALMGPFFGLVSRREPFPPWRLLWVVLSIAAFSFLDERFFLPLLGGWGLFCTFLTYRFVWTLESLPPAPASFHRTRPGGSPSRLQGFARLLQKELTLESAAAAMGMTLPALWLFWVVARRWGDGSKGEVETVIAGALVCFGALGALVAGASSFAEERALGTMAWQEALLPRRRLFWAKLLAVGLTATVLALIVPVCLLTVDPGWDAVREAIIGGRQLPIVTAWLLLALLPGALGVLGSIGQRDLARAFLASLGLGAAAFAIFGVVLGSIGEASYWLSGRTETLSAGCRWAEHPGWYRWVEGLDDCVLGRLPWGLFLFVAVLVWLARRLYLHGRGWRPWVTAAALGFVVIAGDFGLKSMLLPRLLWEAMPHQVCPPTVSATGPAPVSHG